MNNQFHNKDLFILTSLHNQNGLGGFDERRKNMNKLFTKIVGAALGLTMAIGVGVAVSSNREAVPVHAAETITNTITFGSGSKVGSYTSSFDETDSASIGWTISKFNNNNWGWSSSVSGANKSIKVGNKNAASVGTIQNKAELSNTKFTKVDLYISARTSSFINSITVYGGSTSSSVTTQLATVSDASPSKTNPTVLTLSNQSNYKFYKIAFDMKKHSSSNGLLTLDKVCWYQNTSTPVTAINLSGTGVTGSNPNYSYNIASSSDTTQKTVTVGLTPTTATDQVVKVQHYSGTSGLLTFDSTVTCSNGSGSFHFTGKGNGGTEKFKLYGNTETSVISYLEVSIGTYYTVTFNSNGGSTTPASQSVESGQTFTFPSPGTKTHYSFLGWSSNGGSDKYATGATSPAVTGAITYTAYWQEDAKYTITYSAGTNGTGSYAHTNQYGGTYTLLAFANLTGVSANTGYRFKSYTVGGVNKNPGDTFTLSAATTVTVNFEEKPLEYQITFGTAEGTSGITDFSNTSYVIPSGVTLNNIQGNIYSNTSNQAASLRFGKSGTTGSFDATISGNYYITSVKCNLKYYGSDSTATFAVTPSGGSAISKSLTVDWADYTYDVSAAKAKTVTLGTDVNGKRAYLSGFTISYAALKTLSNIALSGTYPTTFTKGDTFSHSGMVVTANYSDSTSATVTSSATWSSPDMSTPGAKTITVSYSDEYGSASQTYSITVSYANPTGIVLSQYTKTLVLLEEFDVADVEVTINPEATADQSLYEWVVQDSDGLVEGDTYEFNDGVFYASEPADAVVLRCQSTKEGYTSTIYADVTVEITGNPIVTLFNASDDDKTNGSESVFTDAGDITYHVSAKNFSGTISYAWSSSDTSVISIDSENGASCDFYVEGDEGSARLSCRVTDTASHDVTVYIDVTVEDWSVTAVSWTAPTIDVFSGATLTTSDVSSWNVKYNTDSGKTNQTAPVGDIVVKVNGAAVSLPHTWVAANDGKTLCVEYRGVSSSTTTVAVTQSIHAVYAPVEGDPSTSTLTFSAACSGSGTSDGGEKWTVTSDGTESAYDPTKGIHYGTGSAAVQYINLKSTDFTTGKITSVVVNASTASGVTATVAVNVGGSAFGGAAKSISQTATEYTFEGEVDADEIEVIITKPSSATKAIYCKSIAVTYVEESEEKVNIANVAAHKAAQRVAVKFAKAFNDAMDDTENCTTGLSAAWSTCSSAYDTFKSEAAALGETEEAYAKNLIKYATAQYSDDSGEACIERMMKTYEICVQKHGQTAFMSELVTLQAARVTPFASIVGNSNTIAIIVVISMISITAIGGYFFLRKRKEN